MKRAALLLVLAIVVLAGLSRLKFDTDVLNLLPGHLPEVQGLKEYQRHFARNDELIISVEGNSAEATSAVAERLAAALSARSNLVAHAAWQPPWLERPGGTAEFLAWLWLSKPPEAVQELRNRLTGEEAVRTLHSSVERLATSLSPLELARLGHDPFGMSEVGDAGPAAGGPDWFASSDGKLRLIFVQPRNRPADLREWSQWLRSVRGEIDLNISSAAAGEHVEIGYTGTPVFTVETAESMEKDMKQSIACAVVLIALLFAWAHRRLWPLGWMLLFLVGALACTMAVGGFIYGNLSVVSLGFAAILLGLGVDYALVSYQELLEHPEASARQVRKVAGPGIWWSAATTALAFLLLNFAGLPGLGQLGTLVAIGIITAAAAMLFGFLPFMTWKPPRVRPSEIQTRPKEKFLDALGWPATAALLLAGAAVLLLLPPRIDRTTNALGSADSAAAKVAARIDDRMSGGAETLWLVIKGQSVQAVRDRMILLNQELSRQATNTGFRHELPLEMWPDPAFQKRNLETLEGMENEITHLEHAAADAGFTGEALELTKSVIGSWRDFQKMEPPLWPGASSGKWLVDRVAARTADGWAALGMFQLKADAPVPAIQSPGVLVAGWSRIAEALLGEVESRMKWLTAGMAAVLTVCLRLALRSWMGVVLSFATLAFGLLLTMVVMALLGWQWNLMSLTAIPLLLGAAVDYTIHVHLSLRRHNGHVAEMRRTIGRALFLVTAGAVAGFGSLAFASNAGLASFELVCATGMICIFFVAIYLLPAWYLRVNRTS